MNELDAALEDPRRVVAGVMHNDTPQTWAIVTGRKDVWDYMLKVRFWVMSKAVVHKWRRGKPRGVSVSAHRDQLGGCVSVVIEKKKRRVRV